MRRAWLIALGVCLLSWPARAQRAVTVQADNDAFNFWQMPWARPDEEYTSGVRLTVELDGAAAWARRLGWALGACADGHRCASHSYVLGQDIYTAARPKGWTVAPPGERPDAGLLWVQATSRVARPGAINEVGWTVGLTGKGSLAEPMQRMFHDIAPHLNRPILWGRQMPSEPVFGVSFDRRRLISARSLEVQPHGGASIGTLLTEVRTGVGFRYPNSSALTWMLPRPAGALSLELTGDAQLRGVARNAMLNGTFFQSSPSVALRPWVRDLTAGLRLRWRALEASWLAHQTGAEHVGRSRPHAWSTLALSWRPTR